MTEQVLLGLISIVVLGISAQWLAWFFKIPSILLLLVFGFIAGPVTGFLDPEVILGETFYPIVSLSVVILLFEGGMNLKMSELKEIGKVVRNMVTVGALISWIVSAVAARLFLRLSVPLAILFGAILVVTGPTVIMPLLRHVRPNNKVGSVLKWEGIIIDPIGAILAVLTFEAIVVGRTGMATALAAVGLLKTVLVGGGLGAAGALVIVILLKRYLIPDYLHNAAALTIAFVVYSMSNIFQTESGLLAVMLMGVVLVNQTWVTVQHIIQFKENLRVLLISSVFIMLAAHLKIEHLGFLGWNSLVFLIILIFIGRPASVFLSTIGSTLKLNERVFLSFIAPRGIVAAAVASIFAVRLVEAGYAQAEILVPLTFSVIIGTVAVYGIAAGPLSKWLGVAQPLSQGFLVVGANPLARAIGKALKNEGWRVLLVDTNRSNVYKAKMEGLNALYGNVLSEFFLNKIELQGIGRVLAMTPNDEVNSLVVLRCSRRFDRAELYQMHPGGQALDSIQHAPQYLRGRLLFSEGMTYEHLTKLIQSGAVVKKTQITEKFGLADLLTRYGGNAIQLFLVRKDKSLMVYTMDNTPKPEPGQTLLSLVSPPFCRGD